MAPTTEFALISLNPGVNLESGPAKAIWDDTLRTLTQQDGWRQQRWGTQIESRDILQLAIDWDNVEKHKAFMASPTYGPFVDKLGSLMASPPTLYHVDFTSSLSTPTSAPVTEVVSFYFPSSISAEKKADFDAAWEDFANVASENAEGMLGFSAGWSVEDVEHKSLEEGKGKAFVAMIGWQSVERHMAYREKQAFKDSIVHLRNRVSGVAMWHVAFKQG